jgi:hypothetical protein
MKWLIFLALALTVITAPLRAEQDQEAADCRTSFELGRLAAGEIPTRRWFWGSYALTCLLATGSIVYDSQHEDEDLMLVTGIAGIVSLSGSIVLPLTVKPRPPGTPPADPAVDPVCYQRGYARKLRGRNTLAALGGYAAGQATVFAVTYTAGLIWLLASWE